jgi:tRNA G46 methylase TrmB
VQDTEASRQLSLLPPSALLRTGPVDHADWNYRPLIGTVQRIRFRLVCRLLGNGRFDRLLEIGYGSGVFMPELAKRFTAWIRTRWRARSRPCCCSMA